MNEGLAEACSLLTEMLLEVILDMSPYSVFYLAAPTIAIHILQHVMRQGVTLGKVSLQVRCMSEELVTAEFCGNTAYSFLTLVTCLRRKHFTDRTKAIQVCQTVFEQALIRK